MKTIFIITLFFIASIAQTFAQQRREILNELNSNRGRGNVTIFEDENITHVLGRHIAPARPVSIAPDGTEYFAMQGFRIQAYVGNNQRTSMNQAHTRRDAIRNAFPEHEAEALFTTPWWRLRVGHFETRDEAEEVMHEMRRRLPALGREMTIVQDNVRIPAHR
jgi:hypothetical protein